MHVQLLLIDIFVLPIGVYTLLKSGNWERKVVRDELADEVGSSVPPEAYEGVLAEKRFRLPTIPRYPRRIGGHIRNAQNSLAFHKQSLKRRNRPVEGDFLSRYYMAEVASLRGGMEDGSDLV